MNEQTSVITKWDHSARIVGVAQDDNLAAWYVDGRWVQGCSVGKRDGFTVADNATQDGFLDVGVPGRPRPQVVHIPLDLRDVVFRVVRVLVVFMEDVSYSRSYTAMVIYDRIR